ncbi:MULTISPECIES: 4'-phosphopantetheinyl transferase family protein [unclassified Variovorax]|uniref:4'-phosphopantetheinyl transferase family protein n=1 Tax=unclassified Variovorax TaxID=663243 RepID=UPI0013194457|nr:MULTISPECIES: 4'-phosphopantetheinyl transferase superfamily protein [unclassified Variovorax]VTU14165.1 4'-phosphopantetheinyl transferase psf-1 [Variovorax sp. SRS16]VTU20188.1 4'-phosphopantetheinyl transferase psf-1 [Variovorax sp. PBL-E5]
MNAITSIGCIEGCALWRVDLDAPDALPWQTLLSAGERARAARFVFERDRRRYLAAHGALRHLLGLRAGTDGQALQFAEGPFGKPFLRDRPGIAFNLSHSQAIGLVAIGEGAIGVDVEVLRPMDDMPALAAAHFTDAEQQALASAEAARQARVFLEIWTRKEGCLKALGAGLSIDTRTIHVGAAATAGASAPIDAGAHGALSASSFDLGAEAIACVARVAGLPAASTEAQCCTAEACA